MTKKRKIIILAGMVALLVVTAVLNIWLLGEKDGENDYQDTASFFTSFRLERETNRTQEVLYLESILDLPSDDEFATAKAAAAMQLARISDIIEFERNIEYLLMANDYEDAVVTIGLDSDSINVILMCDNIEIVDTIIVYSAIADIMGTDVLELVKIFHI